MNKRSFLYYGELETPVGPISLVSTDQGLCRIDFGNVRDLTSLWNNWKKKSFLCGEFIKNEDKVFEAKCQLEEYFHKQRTAFSLEFDLYGTPFQRKVWKALYDSTPYGEIQTYKSLAESIQAPKAIRAVGGAINKNPISIVIPCHRVIGSNGSLVGYNGGMDKKKYLLHLEEAPITQK